MKQTITAAQLAAIREANEAVKGTAEYSRYHMCYEYKHNKAWKFGGYGVPDATEDKPIKNISGKKYIMIDDNRRFTITDEILTMDGMENLRWNEPKKGKREAVSGDYSGDMGYNNQMEECLEYLRVAAYMAGNDEAKATINATLAAIEGNYKKERLALYHLLRQYGQHWQVSEYRYTDGSKGREEDYYYEKGLYTATIINNELYCIKKVK